MKIIADREGKPKGFGYVEFADLDGLKNALSKSGEVCVSILYAFMYVDSHPLDAFTSYRPRKRS